MKLGFGLYRNMLTPESLRFARQVGATHIVAHPPGSAGPANDALMAKYGQQAGGGLSDPNDPIWTYEGLRDLKALVNSEGLELEALENFAPSHWYDVLLDGPRRPQQMERLKQLIRDLGRVGIPIMGYYFSVAGVWGRTSGPNARGGAVSVGFDDPVQPPIPAGMVWDMVYDTGQFDPQDTNQVLAPVSDAERNRPGTTMEFNAEGSGGPPSAFAQKLVDAALQLALFLLALAQPLLDVGDRQFVGTLRAEGDADEIVAPPDHPGEERAALAGDRQRHLLPGQLDDVAELEVRAGFGDIAHHAIPARAMLVDFGDAAVNHLVARVLASIQHRFHSL